MNVPGKLVMNPGEVNPLDPVHDLLVQLGTANKHDLKCACRGSGMYGFVDRMNNRAIRSTEAGITRDYDICPVGQRVSY